MDAQDHVRGLRGEGLTVDKIKAILFDPVACLAEFRPDEFNRAALELDPNADGSAATGSRAYWQLVGIVGRRGDALTAADRARLEALEREAVEAADLYPDVPACLDELRELGVATYLVSSLSRQALQRFLQRFSLVQSFAGVVAREDAGGVAAMPVRHALAQGELEAGRTMLLVDTAEMLDLAKALGLKAVLMINDYDEGRMLAERSPDGGIVSLAELPDALRLIEQRSGLAAQSRAPRQPYDLFDPT
jgi:phosphoglycolate phosphatase-like HAD superfamily hydrolase